MARVDLTQWSDNQLETGLELMKNAASNLRGKAASNTRKDIEDIKVEMNFRGLSYDEPAPPNWRDFI